MLESHIHAKKVIIDQKKNRLKEQEAKLKLEERKARNRRIFELGGLVAKAKLDHLNPDQLYGALLSIADQLNKEEVLSTWAHKCGTAFDYEKKSQGIPISVTFPDKPSMEVRQQLRALGLKWNSLKEEWQGVGDPNQIYEFVNLHGGTAIT